MVPGWWNHCACYRSRNSVDYDRFLFQSGRNAVPEPKGADYSNTKELGRLLYTEYVYAFELAAVLLLVAMVAAIALTLRHRDDKKSLDIAKQVSVKKDERLRIVSMPAEKKD